MFCWLAPSLLLANNLDHASSPNEYGMTIGVNSSLGTKTDYLVLMHISKYRFIDPNHDSG